MSELSESGESVIQCVKKREGLKKHLYSKSRLQAAYYIQMSGYCDVIKKAQKLNI